jgi:RNA-directed DNA polymerase
MWFSSFPRRCKSPATFHPTLAGTPQGGVVSPVIANLALDGLEEAARAAVPDRVEGTRSKVHLVRYADDFIVTAASRKLLVEQVIPAVEAFLAERDLRLSPEKSKVTHVGQGFEFLGAHIRKYGRKLMMKPAPGSLRGFLAGLRSFLKQHKGIATWKLIQELNRRIRGWVNFYRCLVSSRVFRTLDQELFRSLWRWVRMRHPSKRSRWLKAKYFPRVDSRAWTFCAKVPSRQGELFPELSRHRLTLLRASSVTIRRHVKVRAEANPFDPSYHDYFGRRRRTPRIVVLGATA